MSNAFENNDQPLSITVENPRAVEVIREIARIEAQNKALRAIGLHRTVEINQRKLDRLLQEKRDLLEG